MNYGEVFEKNFDKIRSQQAYVEEEDASRKSCIDQRIIPLVNAINDSENYFTTSSCSGRFIAYAQNEVHVKKNCEWIRLTHDPLTQDEMDLFVESIEASMSKYKQIYLKFEPFILHVCCKSLAHAKKILEQSVACGYRNSGLSIGSTKLIVAIRSTQNLEMPVTYLGNLIIDRQYLSKVLIELINDKFKENFERIDKLFKTLNEDCLSNDILLNKRNLKKAEKAQKKLEKKKYFDENRNKITEDNKELKNVEGKSYLINEDSEIELPNMFDE